VNKMLGRAPLSFSGAKRLLQLAADADQRSAMLAVSLAQTALRQAPQRARRRASGANRC
jgi:hypothetical protein